MCVSWLSVCGSPCWCGVSSCLCDCLWLVYVGQTCLEGDYQLTEKELALLNLCQPDSHIRMFRISHVSHFAARNRTFRISRREIGHFAFRG
eukprot:COSAG02_NODE_39633_length_414_cov_41.200000_1_plen_90_part_01